MLIKCPDCEICYRIDAELLPEQGRKLRCFKCGKVWQAMPEELFEETEAHQNSIYQPDSSQPETSEAATISNTNSADDSPYIDDGADTSANSDTPSPQTPLDSEEIALASDSAAPEIIADSAEPITSSEAPSAENTAPTTEDGAPADSDSDAENSASEVDNKPAENLNNDMQEMFSRLNKQTEIIEDFDKKSSSFRKGGRFLSETLRWHNPVMRIFIILGISAFLLLSLFSFRYELTRVIPPLRHFYNAFGFDSVVVGEGLEFQNINRREYEEDYVRKLEVKGLIFNTTEDTLSIPTIRIEMLDKDGNTLQTSTTKAPVTEVAPNERAAFSFTLTQPSPLTKYVYITFSKDTTPNHGN